MKKLMIAAAAAAMIGSVFAEEDPEPTTLTEIYKATIKVTTTKGKKVSGNTPYKLQLGWNNSKEAPKMWYHDVAAIAFTNEYKANFKLQKIDGNMVPVLTPAAKKDTAFLQAFKALNLEATYCFKSKNRWCLDVSWKEPWSGCYRAKTTRTFSGYIEDFCGYCTTAQFLDPSMKTLECWGTGLDQGVLFKIEKNDGLYSKDEDVEMDNLVCDAFAGMGSATSISGSFVGTMDAPLCESCCSLPGYAAAIPFCTEIDEDATVAYGTISVKFDKNVTAKWADNQDL